MTDIIGQWQQGETIQIGVEATTGDPTTMTSVTAQAKRAANGAVPPAATPAAFTFTVTPRTAASDVGAGFDLVATPNVDPGTYAVGLKGVVGGATVVMDPLFIRITASAI
jgi:hypothetical protein